MELFTFYSHAQTNFVGLAKAHKKRLKLTKNKARNTPLQFHKLVFVL